MLKRVWMLSLAVVILLSVAVLPLAMRAQSGAGPYKVVKTVKAGGAGGFDYVYADQAGRKLYVPRTGTTPRITVFNLDTLEPVGEIAASAHGVTVAEGHGFSSSRPVAMWDATTLKPIKTIEVEGGPDGIFTDASHGRVYILSHRSPNVTALDAKDGTVVGTLDLGGAPEQGVADGKGRLYIDLEDKGSIAVVDATTMKLVGTYDLAGKGGTCAGLAMDGKHELLFATCRDPQTMVVLKATDGTILDTLPIGKGTDGAVFNPATMEVFSAQGDGTLTVVKEKSPTSFAVEQTVTTLPHAKTLTLDARTGRVLLIAADFTTPAPAQPGGRPGRGEVIPETFSIVVVGR